MQLPAQISPNELKLKQWTEATYNLKESDIPE
jgi:hypothetical protein